MNVSGKVTEADHGEDEFQIFQIICLKESVALGRCTFAGVTQEQFRELLRGSMLERIQDILQVTRESYFLSSIFYYQATNGGCTKNTVWYLSNTVWKMNKHEIWTITPDKELFVPD